VTRYPDSFSVYLRGLDGDGIGFRVIGDGRHVLDITSDITLFVRPQRDDLRAVAAGLRKLAAAAEEMAGALGQLPQACQAFSDAGTQCIGGDGHPLPHRDEYGYEWDGDA
jgi:hypothetical protein